MTRPPLDLDDLTEGVRAGDRSRLARAITLIESNRPDHREQAHDLINRLLPHTGSAHRVGITGVPGVGKSTFIESLGSMLTRKGRRVAVLAVDPTSSRTGGSILGDKTRMAQLSVDPAAFIRPSPSSGTLGGVTRTTRETMLLCEAAGFDVVLIETVGVGQSETIVAEMVDFFLVLMLAGAGDELQGIKKGVLEIADLLAVNKADGDNRQRAEQSAAEYRAALHLLTPATLTWTPPVMTCSGLTGEGLGPVWDQVVHHRQKLTATGELDDKRRGQQVRWFWAMLGDELLLQFRHDQVVVDLLPGVEARVADGSLAPTVAVEQVLAAYHR
ncbi:MAG: methylmalonyl Co-A mutase-associated GTPase MeaB [Actinomycetia bacterium]|nr:methylmalonyl Co-A mutase-associated GTPase MeaB [Actinomycetes bacterium]